MFVNWNELMMMRTGAAGGSGSGGGNTGRGGIFGGGLSSSAAAAVTAGNTTTATNIPPDGVTGRTTLTAADSCGGDGGLGTSTSLSTTWPLSHSFPIPLSASFVAHGSDHVSRWEGLPLTSGESGGDIGEDGPTLLTDTIKDDEESSKDSSPFNPIKVIKILIPHIILISLLLSYLIIGAIILQRLEMNFELELRWSKYKRINAIYEQVAKDTWSDRQRSDMSQQDWHQMIRARLMEISEAHEEREIRHEFTNSTNMATKWTFPTSLLYVLTVLTTCGYGEVDVNTNAGKIFAVAFALVGIPLMFITAADIGKFLSETLLTSVAQAEKCWKTIQWWCCRRRGVSRSSSHHGGGGGSAGPRDVLEEMGMFGGPEGGEPEPGDSLLFPVGAYVSLICLYCSLGALLFTSYQDGWTFIHAFHFGFNLIVTVGLGRMVCEDGLYLCMIVAYVIIGLSVVTMCVDLASTHLKAYFTKIHYFGQARSRFMGMNEDIREMVQLFAAMRNKKGGKVTWNEFKQFLEADEGRARAFCPKDYNKLRWVDETSSAISTLRHNSVTSDMEVAAGLSGGGSSSFLLRRQMSSSKKHQRHYSHSTVEEEEEEMILKECCPTPPPPPPPNTSSKIHQHAGLV